ncbi:YheC/YheD family protein [Neobacillus sp. WH10]|uniref:YheC/YheD family endospore coat-associated protein n=1 Tax=Neobacillus sp. WH10 TaxID=3047873 RepID=UPI0024C1DF16|nr:YheC/YheD family protein [Neobacillus sp. WH10]WHY78258.1 YheC/YheD family protein [Neobacillus sp. WH10]
MKFFIQTIPSTSSTISIPFTELDKLSLQGKQTITISIGVIQKNAVLSHHNDNDRCIYISSDLLEAMSLPEFIEYEIKIQDDILFIGPILGMLVRGKIAEMNLPRIKIYKNYLIDYQHVNGLIVLFTSDGINYKKKLVNGYAYNPINKEWVEGIFPFPSAVFLRKSIKESSRKKLQKLIGNNFFNSHIFNKWEMWEWFSKSEQLKQNLPETVLAENMEEVKKLMAVYQKTFIKPRAGMQGTGIFQLSMVGKEYTLSYRVKDKNFKTILDNWEAVQLYLQSELNLQNYIVQQKIPLLRNNNRVMDNRVIVVKDQNGAWSVSGMVTKFGDIDSIVSNISSGGSAEKGWQALVEMYQGDSKQAFKKYMEIEKLAITCCEVLESKGLHLGYIGIDIGIDENHHLWVIEINNRNPDMTIALDANDFQLYYKTKSAPFHYAKWLAGFGGEKRDAL